MHETAFIERLLDIIISEAKEKKLKSVREVHLRLGEFRQLSDEFLVLAFDIIVNEMGNPLIKGAKLVVQRVVDSDEIVITEIEGE